MADALATLAACGAALAEAAQVLRGVLGDKRKPIPEIVEALRLVGITHSYVIEAQQRVADLKEELRRLAEADTKLEQWLAKRTECEPQTMAGGLRGGFPVLVRPSDGAVFCEACSDAERRLVPFAPDPRGFDAMRICTGCKAIVYGPPGAPPTE